MTDRCRRLRSSSIISKAYAERGSFSPSAADEAASARASSRQNLAVYFAQLGKNVVLVDCDPTGTNIHTQFGLTALAHPPPLDGGARGAR